MTVFLILLHSLALFLSHGDVDVTGADHRREVSQLRGPVREASQGVATMVRRSGLTRNGSGNYRFTDPNTDFLCPGQRFAGQPAPEAVECGATLVAPDLVSVAAHCMQEELYGSCKDAWSFVFDYTNNRTEFPEDNVYNCKELAQPMILGNGVDVALIRLDRPVKNFKPIPLSEAPLREGDQLTLVGPTKGLPLKASSGRIRYMNSDPADRSGIGTDFDCSGKNSGSPVLNGRGESVGILIASGVLNTTPEPEVVIKENEDKSARSQPEAAPQTKPSTNKCYEWTTQPPSDTRGAYTPNPNHPADYGNMGVLAKGCVFIPHRYYMDKYRATINGETPSPARPLPLGPPRTRQ